MSIPEKRHIQRHEHFIHSSCTQWSVGIFWPNETYFTNLGFPEIRGRISLSLPFGVLGRMRSQHQFTRIFPPFRTLRDLHLKVGPYQV